MEIKAEKITSEQARKYLNEAGLEEDGRANYDDNKVDRYKYWMREGKWSLFYNQTSSKFINEPIIFLEDGRLFEGKHRMRALAEIGDLELDFWVLRGFTKEHLDIFHQWHEDWKIIKAWRN